MEKKTVGLKKEEEIKGKNGRKKFALKYLSKRPFFTHNQAKCDWPFVIEPQID